MGSMTANRAASLSTPVGRLSVRADDEGVTSVTWCAEEGSADGADGSAATEIAARAVQQLAEYFAGDRTTFDLPISLPSLGTSSLAVLTALKDTVGYGETVTYGELAERSGSAVPARAIGSIMGSNPIPIVIGCHRVVAADGLGGYSGGEPGQGRQTKIWLLEHEGALPPTLI
jgi:methylated-DNA-[protein]-cysteine S-methyltransferase